MGKTMRLAATLKDLRAWGAMMRQIRAIARSLGLRGTENLW